MRLITVIGLLAAIFQTSLRAATLQEVAPLAYPRVLPRSEMMADGRIMVLGGYDESGLPVATVEIFNPDGPSWSTGPAMNEARYVPTLTRLKNGKYLVTGGYNGMGATATAEIYDPTVTDPLVNPWSYAAPMQAARYTHTATLLPDGRVLVAGGYDNSWGVGSAEVYDPVANTWTSAGTMSVTDRFWHTATLIGNDRVLVAGSPTSPVCEVYNVVSNTWTTVGSMAENRYCQSTVLLPSGKVMVVGGYDYSSGSTRASAEIFDPATGLWASGGSMAAGRYFATAVNDGNGHVYVVGGYDAGSGAVGGVESYSIVPGTWTAVSGLSYYSLGAAGNLLANGSVVFAGGSVSGSASTSSIVLVLPPPPEDADFDGLTFAQEVIMGYDPSSEDTGHTGVSDASKDWDGDGFSNLFEVKKASLSAAMNWASDNNSYPVGATRLNTGRRTYASHIFPDPDGPRTLKSFTAPWRGTYNYPMAGPLQWPQLSSDAQGQLPFPMPRVMDEYEYVASYDASISDQPEGLSEFGDLIDARYFVRVEPALTMDTKYFYFLEKITLGPGGYNDFQTTWSSFSLDIPAGKHDSQPKDIMIAAAAPTPRGNGNARTWKTEKAHPVAMSSVSFDEFKTSSFFESSERTGALILTDDSGSSYTEKIWINESGTGTPVAHYEKKNGLPKGVSEAIGYVAGSTPYLSGEVLIPETAEDIYLTATCSEIPGIVFPETKLTKNWFSRGATFNGVKLSQPLGSGAKSFPNGVVFRWRMRTASQANWSEIVETKHRLYVTAAAPLTTLRHETLFKISCDGAKDGQVWSGIWAKFAGRSVARLDGKLLGYYRNWFTSNKTTESLIKYGDGACDAWTRLMLDCIALQGDNAGKGLQVTSNSDMFAVKNWSIAVWQGAPSDQQYINWCSSQYPYHEPVGGVRPNGYKWAVSPTPEWVDADGMAGQGGVGNPASLFGYHQIVVRNGVEFYDPSYGGSFYPNLFSWRNASLAWFVNVNANAGAGSDWKFVLKQPSVSIGVSGAPFNYP